MSSLMMPPTGTGRSPYIFVRDGDREDWMEIYNPNPFAIELGGWSLKFESKSGELIKK